MKIVGNKVVLRNPQEADLEEYHRLHDDFAEMGEYWPPVNRSLPELRKKWQENGLWEEHSGYFLITDRADRQVGSISFYKSSHYAQGYEIGGLIFRRVDRAQGYMSEALRLFAAFLFESKNIPRLQIVTAVENEGSRMAAEKCGFQCEGIMRRYMFLRGCLRDAALYSLLREQCPRLADIAVREPSTNPD